MHSLRHINKYFLKYKVRLSLGILFVALSNWFAVYSVPYVRLGIDHISNAVKVHEPFATASGKLWMYAGIILLMSLVSGIFMFLMRQTIIVMSRLIENDLKNEVYAHYQKLDIAFYKRNNTGDLMNRISEDVSRVRMYIGPAIMYIVNTIVTFGLTIYVMLDVNKTLTFYVLLPLPVLVVTIYYVSDLINKRSTLVQEKLSDLSTLSQESFSGIRILKAYRRENFFIKKNQQESGLYFKRNLSMIITDAMFQPAMIVLVGLSTIFTVYIGGLQAIEGNVTAGNIAEFIIYVNKLTWPVASLGWVTSLIQRAAASQKRINEFLNTEPEIKNTNTHALELKGDVVFNNVFFVYPDSGIRALDGVTFNVKPGKSLAIVGRTGSGKSTIANLLCRLYDVTTGEILIDGKNIREQNLNELRTQTGYVPQEVFLFSDSIANNIAFASEKISRQAIEQAASDAMIHANIVEFPQQFDTVVGERGITLSGGQKQRISIARAIVKPISLLIFDDCLSAVDTETEEHILNNLKRIMQGKTTIIISHRISSVKHFDHIIYLENGKVSEQGSHEQLLALKSAYFRLYEQQKLKELKPFAV